MSMNIAADPAGCCCRLMLPAITYVGPVAGFLLLICAAAFIWSIHGETLLLSAQQIRCTPKYCVVQAPFTPSPVSFFLDPELQSVLPSSTPWVQLADFLGRSCLA